MQPPPGYPPGPPGYGYPPPPDPYGAPAPQYPYGPPPPVGGGGFGGGAPPPKQGMSVAAIVLIVLAVLCALGGGSCVVCLCVVGKTAQDAKEQEDLDRSRARNVRADELLSSYRNNEVRADQMYKNKWVQVMGGQVDDVRSDHVLIGTGKLLEIPEVKCVLKSDQTSKAGALYKGRRVNVRGKVQGLIFHVYVTDCEIM